VKVGPRRPGDPAVLVASSERIASALGWNAQASSLETIVASAWEWETTFSQAGGPNHPTGALRDEAR
jgi:UDP-glucose 4-epimerase